MVVNMATVERLLLGAHGHFGSGSGALSANIRVPRRNDAYAPAVIDDEE